MIDALLVLALVYAVLIAGYSINLATVLILAGLVVGVLFIHKIWLPKSIFAAGVVFLLLMVISSIFSISPRRSLEQTWIILTAAFIIIALANLRNIRNFRGLTLLSLLIAGLFWMIISWRDMIQWYATWRETSSFQAFIPDLPYRLNGGNTIAAFYSVLFFISLILVIRAKPRWIRAVMAVYGVSVSALLFLSSSRGAWVGMIFGLLAFLIFEKHFLHKAFLYIKKSRILSIAFLLVLIAGAAILLVFYQKYVANHPTHGSGMNRAPFWNPALAAFLNSPLIGNGPYTGGSFYIQSASVPWSQIYLHAHNTYLDVLRDMGILGFLSFTALLVFLFIEMIKIYRANRNIYFYEIVLCSAIAFLGHSIFDGNYLMPFAAVSMLILTGLALNPGLEVQPGGMNIKPYAIAAGVVVLAGAVFLLWNRSTFSAGITSFQEQDFKKSAAWFEKSRQVDRRNPIGYIYHGLLAAHLAENSQPEYLDIAIADFQTALNLDPNWAVTHANLAALYLTAGETDLAKSFFEKSQQLSPDWYVPKLNLGLIFEIENDLQRARDNYFSALSAYTEISGSSFWRTNGIREDVLKAWLNLNPKKEYSLEDYSSVMAQASPMPMIELGGELVERNYELAHKLLLRSKLVYPPYPYIDVERVWLEAELHAEQGNLLKAVSAGKSVLASLRRDGLFGPGSAGLSLYYDGLYRAPVLPVEFVPQLITITLPGKWEQRLYQLAGWEMKNGDQAECLNTIETLLRYAPEYLTVNQVSPPCKAE